MKRLFFLMLISGIFSNSHFAEAKTKNQCRSDAGIKNWTDKSFCADKKDCLKKIEPKIKNLVFCAKKEFLIVVVKTGNGCCHVHLVAEGTAKGVRYNLDEIRDLFFKYREQKIIRFLEIHNHPLQNDEFDHRINYGKTRKIKISIDPPSFQDIVSTLRTALYMQIYDSGQNKDLVEIIEHQVYEPSGIWTFTVNRQSELYLGLLGLKDTFPPEQILNSCAKIDLDSVIMNFFYEMKKPFSARAIKRHRQGDNLLLETENQRRIKYLNLYIDYLKKAGIKIKYQPY